MTPPKVWNKRHPYPTDAVYVGRPSRWGNPYGGGYTREHAIEQFREYLERNPALVRLIKRDLRGKHLVCWCAPRPCHADLLLRIANEP